MKTILRSALRAFRVALFCASCFSAHATPLRDLTLTEAEWIAPNIMRVPFTLTGTLITVQARVDTVEGNFFLDTGANGLLLNTRYFGNPHRGALASSGSVTGLVRVRGSITVDSFRMDNLLASGISAELIDLSHIERAKKTDLVGLIGHAVFADYEILFDYSASLLLLVRTDEKGNPYENIPQWEYKPLGAVPIMTQGHIAVLRLKFGSKYFKRFGIDSGAEQNLLSTGAGKRFLKENFEIRKRVKLRGAGQKSIEVLSGMLRNASLDTFQFKPMATLLTNLSEINAAYQTTLDGLLGYEFLSQRPVSINHRKQSITFYDKVRP